MDAFDIAGFVMDLYGDALSTPPLQVSTSCPISPATSSGLHDPFARPRQQSVPAPPNRPPRLFDYEPMQPGRVAMQRRSLTRSTTSKP